MNLLVELGGVWAKIEEFPDSALPFLVNNATRAVCDADTKRRDDPKNKQLQAAYELACEFVDAVNAEVERRKK